jgi:large repetitive protein
VLTVRVRDAAGEEQSVPETVNVDAHAPVAVQVSPAGQTIELRPQVGFAVDPGPSGLGSFEAALDGQPMTISGDSASFTPSADLDYGTHTITWRAADGAGNARDGFWTFQVVDASPPAISAQVPADGASGSDRRPSVGFTLTDVGTGVDASTLHVVLDGVDVTGAGTLAGGDFSYVPAADLALGGHQVRVTVSDRSGNAMPAAQWSFSVVDTTPPELSDVRPTTAPPAPTVRPRSRLRSPIPAVAVSIRQAS